MAEAETKEIDWDEVQIDYEQRNLPVRQIAVKYGISERALYKHIRDEGWIQRRPTRQSDNASTSDRFWCAASSRHLRKASSAMRTVPTAACS